MPVPHGLPVSQPLIQVNDNPKVEIVRVAEPHQGQRIDNFLIRHLKGVPRSRIYRLIRRGEVRLNKKRCQPAHKLQTGDLLRIPPVIKAAPSGTAAASQALRETLLSRVLYEDERLLVIDKPAGMAVHGGSGIRLGLLAALRQSKTEWDNLELCHRLDRDTSGCLVLARDSRFLKHLQQAFKSSEVRKRYLALVHGNWPAAVTEVNAPLRKNKLSSGERIVRVVAEGKRARTRFRIVRRFPAATLLEAMPETGRTHQIRVHCQNAGHPIVGDSRYSLRSHGAGPPPSLARVRHLCLHAAAIGFRPGPGEALIEIEAPLREDLQVLLESLDKKS